MDQRSGTKAEQRGPSFTPPANPWPNVVAIVALVVVGTIVVAATLLGGRSDPRPPDLAAAGGVAATSASARPPTARSDRMEFATDGGDGVLIITSARWSATGRRPPAHGSYLHVQVQLVCTAGELDYGPDNFSAFDATGELFEVLQGQRAGTPLGYGVIAAGESVRGTIAFDLPRGDVTLLLSDAGSRSVTALLIPD